jgi:peptidoglycan/xylan/chitin deacetylase (PgdA/CDA1 family)
MRHDSVFVSAEYDGFCTPGDRKRTFDRVLGSVPWGLPRFRVGPALANRAFIPSQKLLTLVTDTVPQDKASAHAFFQAEANVSALQRRLAELPAHRWGDPEPARDYRQRVENDLLQCKDTLERELGRPERALAWPWGAYSDTALAVARDLGYRLFFCTTIGPNPPGRAGHIHRFKARNRPAPWLRSRLFIYRHPWLARAYQRVK